ncbi:MAG: 1,4-dihydroxy-6-naphthoate synthase [Gammaproteobacteria bacterium]|nr:MAG: 1,4-dihydroxy-6-naphthoate synthase [Gammaproteobacteria bacterium]
MPTEAFTDVLFAETNGIATITINRPEVHNAFRERTIEELTLAFEMANCIDSVGVIVLTGAGDQAFCTGGDVMAEQKLDRSSGQKMFAKAMHLSTEMRNGGKPIIAAVRGYCIGGGNELNLQCDLTIAADNAVFGHAGPRVGSAPLWWGTQLLPRLVGDKRAREIIYLCRQYRAEEAERMGWVNRVVPLAELDQEVQRWAGELLAKSPQALRIARVSLNFESDQSYASVLHGGQLINLVQASEEFKEGMTAFLERRKPDFERFRRGASWPIDEGPSGR